MADIRIKDLTTTASSTASDDFIAVDGTTNGTRKLNAFSPTFGGNATVTGTLTVNGTTASVGAGTGSIISKLNGAAGSYKLSIYQSAGVDRWYAGLAAGAESGSDGGAPYSIVALTDAGAVIDNALLITRAAGGSITTPRPVSISATTASTTTSTGALVVSGGVGVGNEVSVYGRVRAQLGLHADGNVPAGLAAAYQVDVQAGTSRDILSFGDSSRAGLIRGEQDGSGRATLKFGRYTASTFAEYLRITGVAATDAVLSVYGTTASTSTSSGALVVSGGVGVAGAIYAGGNITIDKAAPDFTLTRSVNTNSGLIQLTTSTTYDFAIGLRNTTDSDLHIYNYGTSNDALKIARSDSLATFGGAVRTAAPSGGTAANWKLGTVATVSPTSPNRTIEVDIGGTIYYIHAKTTNN